MIAASYPFLDVLWTMVIFFIWILWFTLLFRVWGDIFRRHDLSGLGKTGWLIFTIVLPFLGVFIYLITQNDAMTQARHRSSAGTARPVRRLCAYDGDERRCDGRDREGQGAARLWRDHAGGVRRDQAEGSRVRATSNLGACSRK